MAEITADQTAAVSTRTSPWSKLRTVHKVCGLAALVWLSVLGLTGWILDHHEWRWSHQWTVPGWVTSPAINRLVRGTVMRYVVADPNDETKFLGASERGLWLTSDRGETWTDVRWDGASDLPQTYDLLPGPAGSLDEVWAATDDGIWRVTGVGARAERFALAGMRVTSLSQGTTLSELIGAIDEATIFRIDTAALTTFDTRRSTMFSSMTCRTPCRLTVSRSICTLDADSYPANGRRSSTITAASRFWYCR